MYKNYGKLIKTYGLKVVPERKCVKEINLFPNQTCQLFKKNIKSEIKKNIRKKLLQ